MASGVVLRRRKIISDHLNNISFSARCYFTLGHAKSTNLIDSNDSKKNVMLNSESAFGLFTSRCYVNIASGIRKPEFGPRTTTSRFISSDPTSFEDFQRESWASNYKSRINKALARLEWFNLRIKFLCACVSISLRLLVKVCRGESLSRRERHLLTQASGIIKPEFGPRTTTSRFISSDPTSFEDFQREYWASNYKSRKNKALARLDRFKLRIKFLCACVSISLRLLVKVCRGESLSRRERQLLTRTTSYIIRDVPGALIIGVPLINFLLPLFLKLFPYMLRSTFQDKLKEQLRKRKSKARIEFAKFLQDTVKEMDQVVQISWRGGRNLHQTARDLFRYTDRVSTGRPVCHEKFLNCANLFNDKITLDNISRRRLVNMCKYMEITAYGSDEYLRFMLRERLKLIRKDDKLIQKKGVESLSEAELSKYCRERGICAGEEMRQQLRDWLDLSVSNNVPSSLLILSRAFTVIGKEPVEVLLDTLRSLPYDLIYTVGSTSLPSENPSVDMLTKLACLDLQKKHIKKEDKELWEKKQSDIHTTQDDVLNVMTNGAPGQARARAVDEQGQLCELSNAMAVLASALNVYTECEKILRLVNDEINHANDKMGENSEDEAKEKQRDPWGNGEDLIYDEGDKVTSVLTDKVDAMVKKIGKEFNNVDAKIERYCDGKISAEVVAAVALLKDSLDKEGIQELICKHSKYKEEIVKLGIGAEDVSADDTS